MFSLYGVNGRVFRGSLEQLRQIGCAGFGRSVENCLRFAHRLAFPCQKLAPEAPTLLSVTNGVENKPTLA